jgi:hypothetical protein
LNFAAGAFMDTNLISLLFRFLRGTAGPNRYGPDPLAV